VWWGGGGGGGGEGGGVYSECTCGGERTRTPRKPGVGPAAWKKASNSA